jgi:hypothetical protein
LNTFLPWPDYERSARDLHMQLLNAQRREALQLIMGQFPGHPAAMAWRGHHWQLAQYGLWCCHEWTRRGYADSCEPQIRSILDGLEDTGVPRWFGRQSVHDEWKARLLSKYPAHYAKLYPKVKPNHGMQQWNLLVPGWIHGKELKAAIRMKSNELLGRLLTLVENGGGINLEGMSDDSDRAEAEAEYESIRTEAQTIGIFPAQQD